MNNSYEKNLNSVGDSNSNSSRPIQSASSNQKDFSQPDLTKETTAFSLTFSWQAKEFEKVPRSQQWYLGVFIFLFVMLTYAFITNNLLMAIIFILFAVLAYLFDKKEPRLLQCSINKKGVTTQKNLYEYAMLESFWIFYEPMGRKILSLKSKKKYLPFIHLPIGQANPAEIRKVLLNYLPEEKQEEGLSDVLENFM